MCTVKGRGGILYVDYKLDQSTCTWTCIEETKQSAQYSTLVFISSSVCCLTLYVCVRPSPYRLWLLKIFETIRVANSIHLIKKTRQQLPSKVQCKYRYHLWPFNITWDMNHLELMLVHRTRVCHSTHSSFLSFILSFTHSFIHSTLLLFIHSFFPFYFRFFSGNFFGFLNKRAHSTHFIQHYFTFPYSSGKQTNTQHGIAAVICRYV